MKLLLVPFALVLAGCSVNTATTTGADGSKHDCTLVTQDMVDIGNLTTDITAGTVTNDEAATKFDRIAVRLKEHSGAADPALAGAMNELAVSLGRLHVDISAGTDTSADTKDVVAKIGAVKVYCP